MTQLNCKPGDLAIVVCAENPENLGQIVEVLGLPNGRPFKWTEAGHAWRVRTVSRRKTLMYVFRSEADRIARHAYGPVPDRCLRPVSGLADGDETAGALGKDQSVAYTGPVEEQVAEPLEVSVD